MNEFNIGDPLDDEKALVRMPPPVVFQTQPAGYVPLETPEQLRAWERSVRMTTGLEIVADNIAGVCCETGSNFGQACNSDDSGLA